MRKIVAGLFISIDGVVEDPHLWHFPYFNDEMGAAVTATLRVRHPAPRSQTYDSFAGAWPDREAAGRRTPPWQVARRRPQDRRVEPAAEFTWRNSEQLQGDLVEAVAALKNEPGDTNIAMSGSVSIVRQLLAAGLLDELHLLVHPIAVRKGMRLFDEGDTQFPLTLISSQAFTTGVLNLVYGPADSNPEGTYEDAKAHLPQSD